MRLRRLSLAEIAKRRADAARDVDLLESGWQPTAAQLAAAPLMDHWQEATYPGTTLPTLVGKVSGHPELGDTWAGTSPIIARGDGWVRTEGRFYRLGTPHGGRKIGDLIRSLPVVQPPQPRADDPLDPIDPCEDEPGYGA